MYLIILGTLSFWKNNVFLYEEKKVSLKFKVSQAHTLNISSCTFPYALGIWSEMCRIFIYLVPFSIFRSNNFCYESYRNPHTTDLITSWVSCFLFSDFLSLSQLRCVHSTSSAVIELQTKFFKRFNQPASVTGYFFCRTITRPSFFLCAYSSSTCLLYIN